MLNMNKSELEVYLTSHRVPVEEWGTRESKTLGHLLAELGSGESNLIESDTGELIRAEIGVGINVYYIRGDTLLKLEEARQIFSDGRVRTRKLSTSIGEKVKPGEHPDEAALRTFQEELGISSVTLLNPTLEDRPPVISESFPGLVTKRRVHRYDVQMSDEDFREDGYIETQTDKTTFFVWEEVNGGELPLVKAQGQFLKQVTHELGQYQIPVRRINSRIKSGLSEYDRNSIVEPHDRVGVRVILDSEADCYRAKDILVGAHQTRRVRDYITHPWSDGYRSLHVDLQFKGVPVEAQIRTLEMDGIANELIGTKGNHYWKLPNFKKFG